MYIFYELSYVFSHLFMFTYFYNSLKASINKYKHININKKFNHVVSNIRRKIIK